VSPIPLLSLALGFASFAPAADEAKPDPAAVEFFESKVRPVLAANCLGCHGPDKQKAGLRLDSRSAMIEGGDSGPALKPGDPDDSRLIEVIRYGSDVQMPPKRKLSDDEIAAVTQWVRSGAPWLDAAKPTRPPAPAATGPKVSAEDRAYWAFQPVRAVAPPPVTDEAWPRSPIDRFVLARLEEKGLRPVEAADRRTWLRRVTFDLIGLPPTPEDVDAFHADESSDAFGKVVDRLLASPHYGERWGRHWLDIARYGEDQAHTFQARLYPYGYRYRDWVVQSLNDDKPYDQFIVEQIAGDLLDADAPGRDERLAATGLFSLGPVYYGKAVYDELDDRVDTLTRGFLGLTVACARCHDHKFDPIAQHDYYALAGIFSSTAYKETYKAPAEDIARYEEGQTAIKDKTDGIAAFLKEQGVLLAESSAPLTAKYVVAAWTLHNRRKSDPQLATGPLAKDQGLEASALDRWVRHLFGEKAADRPHLALWNRAIAGQDKAKDLSGDESARAEVAKAADALQSYVVSSLALRDALARQRAALAANGLDAAKLPALDEVTAAVLNEIVSADGVFAVARNDVESRLPDDAKKALKAKKSELDKLKKGGPAKPPIIHGLADADAPANMKVFLRGNASTPGEEAPRRFLEVLSGPDAKPFSQGSGRLELARAIASPDNPLTSRVIVNRIWERHFGRGLVSTPSNFGHMGEPPSHPELLDYLAGRLVASGWSLKSLHKEIALSGVYRLSAQADPTNDAADPANVLLWRANRRRLEVESWRDAMLAVTGELDPTLGGPSIDLKSDNNRRRTLYAAISRHNLDGLLRLFDFPDPNLTSDRRTVTTVPLQQLFVLNSPFMERQAKALAKRLTSDPSEADEARVRRAFSLLYARPATESEVRSALGFLSEAGPGAEGAPSGWEQLSQVLLGTNEFLYVD
jgi:mono/diheme cytochrome c family protein